MQGTFDDELFVGLGDLKAAVDDDSAANVAEPSATELETCPRGGTGVPRGAGRIIMKGAALSVASGWYAKISEGAYSDVIRDALLKAVVERPPLAVSAIADRCQALMTRRGGQAREGGTHGRRRGLSEALSNDKLFVALCPQTKR